MALAGFLFEAALISLSGVMAPGPITTVAVGKGSESPHAGAFVALGHGVVEVPLMIAVFFGAGRLLQYPSVQAAIALVGGLFLLFMGLGMLRTLGEEEVAVGSAGSSPFVAGILLSAGNPYFLVWWVTVGAALILRSLHFGIQGALAFGAVHWSCDLLWDYFLSALSYKGGRFFGRTFQRGLFMLCGVFLVFFGIKFIANGVAGFLA
ncbi:MAG: LysE family transporter [Chloroflexota bacterium]|nr:LysE family transporter [Chloroflexota bacterium]